jgi:L-seryl-tRNA(Ser) seleniumtransferase
VITLAIRAELAELRTSLSSPTNGDIAPDSDELAARIAARVELASHPTLHSAINATGIVLHTGLGRARLHWSAIPALTSVGVNHSILEIDAETGERGSRQNHVNHLLCELTGAEAAAVVNNCAAAVLLAVTALAAGKDVILSRGEMVEIGGAFRMPEIIKACGAKLVEVGTTNRTRIADYRRAITDQTALILRCHPSNYRVVGFTEAATSDELIALGQKHAIPVMEDQGSGALIDPVTLGLSQHHGSLPHSVAAGYDLITASGDKLMGAAQAGILLGKRHYIDVLMTHPLARALRVDKMTLAGLESTLRLYRDPAKAINEIPTLRYLTRTAADIKRAANRLKAGLRKSLPPDRFSISLLEERSHAGGGSLPGDELPTTCVAIRSLTTADSVGRISASMRGGMPPVFGRIKDDAYLLDPRTMENFEIDIVVQVASRLITTG